MKTDYVNKREIYLPNDAVKTEYSEIKTTVYTYLQYDKLVAVAFGGKRTKKDWGYTFNDQDSRSNYINKFIAGRFEMQEQSQIRKLKEKQAQDDRFKDIKVGDIFCESGGYDQTNVHFYQLIALKGKTGTFKNIQKDFVEGSEGYMSAQVVPVKDAFTSESYQKRIQGNRFKAGFYNAYKTDPKKSHYCSWYA